MRQQPAGFRWFDQCPVCQTLVVGCSIPILQRFELLTIVRWARPELTQSPPWQSAWRTSVRGRRPCKPCRSRTPALKRSGADFPFKPPPQITAQAASVSRTPVPDLNSPACAGMTAGRRGRATRRRRPTRGRSRLPSGTWASGKSQGSHRGRRSVLHSRSPRRGFTPSAGGRVRGLSTRGYGLASLWV